MNINYAVGPEKLGEKLKKDKMERIIGIQTVINRAVMNSNMKYILIYPTVFSKYYDTICPSEKKTIVEFYKKAGWKNVQWLEYFSMEAP